MVAVDSLPENIPDFEGRKLGVSELADYADAINVDEMIYALSDRRTHVRINAARAGRQGRARGACGGNLGLACRDSIAQVRREAAKALGRLGAQALPAALIWSARSATSRPRSPTPRRCHERAARCAGEILCDAIESPAENIQVNAAIGLGMIGENRAGTTGRKALETRRTGGFVRTREAVFKALAMWKA